jgi:hypothetical protein
MLPIQHLHNGRSLDATLDDKGVVTIHEEGRPDARYSVGDAMMALCEQYKPDDVLRSTTDDAIRALLRRHASAT